MNVLLPFLPNWGIDYGHTLWLQLYFYMFGCITHIKYLNHNQILRLHGSIFRNVIDRMSWKKSQFTTLYWNKKLRFFYISSALDNLGTYYVSIVSYGTYILKLQRDISVQLVHYNDVIMGAIASQISSLTIVYSIVIQTQIKENIKAPRHRPLCGEFTGDRWIPRTNGQLRGKCFHLMTSSCAEDELWGDAKLKMSWFITGTSSYVV